MRRRYPPPERPPVFDWDDVARVVLWAVIALALALALLLAVDAWGR
jgi:hypothetical protein